MTENDRHNKQLDVVAPVLEPMPDAEIDSLLERFPQVGSYTARIRNGNRPYSAGSAVETTEGRFFLKKRLASWRDAEEIRWQHRVIGHLKASSFPTPAVLSDSDGNTLVQSNGFYYELFEAARGADIYRGYHTWMAFDRTEHAREAGRLLGRFHEELSDFAAAQNPQDGIPRRIKPMAARFDLCHADDLCGAVTERAEASAALASFLSKREWQGELERLYSPFLRELHPYLEKAPERVTHGDWHANNLFFEGDRIVDVIDFHLTDVSHPMYDLAVALDRNAILWLNIMDGKHETYRSDVLAAILEGYAEVRPLSDEEATRLCALFPIHQIDLALSNVQYYLEVEADSTRATWAYEVYLLEHTRFFTTEPGRALLNELRRAVDQALEVGGKG